MTAKFLRNERREFGEFGMEHLGKIVLVVGRSLPDFYKF
jgi:hypothetical protein